MNNAKLRKLWDSLHSSYWFIPMLMAIGAVILAFLMISLDRAGKAGPIEQLGWVYTGGPNWRGYRIAAWIGQGFLGVAVLAAAVQGNGLNAIALACFLIASLIFVVKNDHLPIGIAIGALWEVTEWTAGKVLATEVIGSLDDTIVDLVMDSLGAGFAAVISLWALQEWTHFNRHS